MTVLNHVSSNVSGGVPSNVLSSVSSNVVGGVSNSVLTIEGLTKRFGNQVVLNGLDLNVARGEIVGLLGPNGCGKSTTLNIVCG